MGPLNIRNTLYTIFLVTALFSKTRKEKAILEFIDARYSANIDSVRSFLDEDFIYYHIPYIGLGINTEKIGSGIVVTAISPFSDTKSELKVGENIIEINGSKLNNISKYDIEGIIKGSANDSVKVTYRRGNNTLSSVVRLAKQQYKQNSVSFIEDIKQYGDRWYEYDLKILDIFSKKNKFVVYYEWEGILFEKGSTYSYRCMEIIKTAMSNNKVYSVDAVWTEKQFKDQFK